MPGGVIKSEAPAAPLGVDGGEVALAVLVPTNTAIPDKKAAATQAGNLTLHKMPKTEHAALYTQFVAGHALVTLRETLGWPTARFPGSAPDGPIPPYKREVCTWPHGPQPHH